MKKATTDSLLSHKSREFEWNTEGLTQENLYILPPVLKWLKSSGAKSLLDLGCGNGSVSNEFASADYAVTGMDHSTSGIRIARENYPAAQFLQHNLENPLPPNLHGQFDAVVSLEVIEHLFFPRILLHRAAEALKPGGLLILSTPYHGYFKNLALALFNQWDSHCHPLRDYGHIKFFSRATLEQILAEEKFQVSAVAYVGRIPALAKSIVVSCRKSA